MFLLFNLFGINNMKKLKIGKRKKVRAKIQELSDLKNERGGTLLKATKIAELVGVSHNSVKTWSQRETTNNATKSQKKLDEPISDYLYQLSKEKINGENIGSSREIVQKIYNKFKINTSISTVGRYLKKHARSILKNKKIKENKKLHEHKNKKKHQFCTVKIIKHNK